MKLVTFETSGARHIGAVLSDGRSIADFTAASAAPHFRDMLALIDGGDPALEEARAMEKSGASVVQLSAVKLLAPVPEPRQMRDFLCFEMHLRQARANRYLFTGGERGDPAKMEIPKVWYDQPIYYKCNRFSVVGTGHDVAKALAVGADVAMVTSAALREGPHAFRRILDGLARWLDEHEYASVGQLRGSMSYAATDDPSAFERANYRRVLGSWATPVT